MFEDFENGICLVYDVGGICVLFKDIKEFNVSMLVYVNYYFENMYDYLMELDIYSLYLEMFNL